MFYVEFIKETTLVDDDDEGDHDAQELNGSVSN